MLSKEPLDELFDSGYRLGTAYGYRKALSEMAEVINKIIKERDAEYDMPKM
jgi:hypothetical protein